MKGLSLAFLVSISLMGGSLQIEDPPAVFSGTVLDAVTGQPVEGARVRIAEGTSAPPDFDVRSPAPVEEPRQPGLVGVNRPGPNGEREIIRDQLDANGERTITGERTTQTGESIPMIEEALARPPANRRAIYTSFTDALGRYEFRGFERGAYTLAVDRDGYVYQVHGQRVAFGAARPLELGGGENDSLVVRMTPTAALTGSVTDPDDEAVADLPVYLLRQEYTELGDRVLRAVVETVTDAQGRFVLTDVPAGRYTLAAGRSGMSAGPQRGLPAFGWTYFPGVDETALAGWIEVLAGTRIDGIELAVAPAETWNLGGRILDSRTGGPPESVIVSLVDRLPFNQAGTSGIRTLRGRYDPAEGDFGFDAVPDGFYRLEASFRRVIPDDITQLTFQAAPDAYALVEVHGSDIEDLELSVPGLGSLRGEVRLAGGESLVGLEGQYPLELSFRATSRLGPVAYRTPIDPATGAFEVSGSLEGRYEFGVAGMPPNVYVSESRLNGARVTDGVLEIPKDAVVDLQILLNPDGGEIEGLVVNGNGDPLPGVRGLLLPDPLPQIIGARHEEIYVDAGGRFDLRGIAPGAWKVYVWEDVNLFEYFDPELLRPSSVDAVPVRIDAATRASVRVEALSRP